MIFVVVPGVGIRQPVGFVFSKFGRFSGLPVLRRRKIVEERGQKRDRAGLVNEPAPIKEPDEGRVYLDSILVHVNPRRMRQANRRIDSLTGSAGMYVSCGVPLSWLGPRICRGPPGIPCESAPVACPHAEFCRVPSYLGDDTVTPYGDGDARHSTVASGRLGGGPSSTVGGGSARAPTSTHSEFAPGSDVTSVSSAEGTAPGMEKTVWCFTTMQSLHGIGHLLSFRKLELNGDCDPEKIQHDIEAHPNGPVLKHNPAAAGNHGQEMVRVGGAN